MKKILSLLLSVAFMVTVYAFPASAAEKLSPEETNGQILTKEQALEKKYGIDITYPPGTDGYVSITLNNLETLDLALSTMTPALVNQVSQYYEQRNGEKINVNYVFSNNNYYNGGVVMAAFERTTSKVYVFLPATAGKAIVSGENPIALVHEFGHAFHLMCADYYGERRMYDEWSQYNNGISYNRSFGLYNPDETVFISEYASTSFEEDIAEVFAHAFVRNIAGMGFKNLLAKDSQWTGLGKKVNYVENMLSVYLTDSANAVANYHKIYQTPVSMTFEGLKFSGDYLQYSGYPQPKNVLKGILKELRMTSQKSTWVRSIGAWRIIDDSGDMYFVFPGGSWSAATSTRQAA